MSNEKRKKPKFFRQGWDRYIKIGKTTKKKRKWRKAYGGDSKIRLKEKGRAQKPTAGWSASKEIKNKVSGFEAVRVLNLNDFKKITDVKKQAVIIGSVGAKKKKELIKKAEEMKIKILNKYKVKKNEA